MMQVDILETKKEDSITVARNGKPVVKITLINEASVTNRIGISKGKFTVKGDLDADNDAIAQMMTGGSSQALTPAGQYSI